MAHFRPFLKYLLWFIIILLSAVATFLILLFSGGFGHIPTSSELKDIRQETASRVYSDDGQLIGKFFKENRTQVVYDSLPTHLINALVATEDARFYDHEGIDTRSLIRVLIKTIIMGDRSSGGGSTLSQQLAKNLFGRNDYGTFSVPLNKLKEILLANRLENLYPKEAIIELYFNTVPFGENVYGIEAAAMRYFSKSTSQLNLPESAVLVGLLKANTYYNPRLHPEQARQRRNTVFSQMSANQYLTAKQADSLQRLPLELNYRNLELSSTLSYYLHKVKREAIEILKHTSGEKYQIETDGLVIQTTLNYQLQTAAFEAVKKQLMQMQPLLDKLYQNPPFNKDVKALAKKILAQTEFNNDHHKKKRLFFDWKKGDTLLLTTVIDSIELTLTQLHAGVIGLDPQNGTIRSWVGGIDYHFYPYDQIMAKRQVASTVKPIIYAAALDKGLQPCDYFSNKAVVLTDYDNWAPQNYDGESGGAYSMAAALAHSKNLPTLDIYLKTGWEAVANTWNRLGFIEPFNKDPSAMLGTNSGSLLEMAIAYASFANGGYAITPYFVEKIYDQQGTLIYERSKTGKAEEILEKEIAMTINSMLYKAAGEGTGKQLYSRYHLSLPWASKTGTSQDYADAWNLVYNDKIVLGTRVGASYPGIHFQNGSQGSGSTLALPINGSTLAAVEAELYPDSELSMIPLPECDDFKEDNVIDKVFDIFRNKETTLEEAEKRSQREGIFKKIFGKKKD
jgi:penicillin-binding protein 1A